MLLSFFMDVWRCKIGGMCVCVRKANVVELISKLEQDGLHRQENVNTQILFRAHWLYGSLEQRESLLLEFLSIQ